MTTQRIINSTAYCRYLHTKKKFMKIKSHFTNNMNNKRYDTEYWMILVRCSFCLSVLFYSLQQFPLISFLF